MFIEVNLGSIDAMRVRPRGSELKGPSGLVGLAERGDQLKPALT